MMAMLKSVAGFVLALAFMGSAHGMLISYSAELIGGSDWRVQYTATNDSASVNVNEVTIYFDRNLFSNLSVETSPADWDSLVIQPDPGIPADGFFDTLALAGGIVPGGTVGGFAVRFTYLGRGTPGAQNFDTLDDQFNLIGTGTTVPDVPDNAVPEPHGLLLAAAGLAALVARQRTRKAGDEPALRGDIMSGGDQHA